MQEADLSEVKGSVEACLNETCYSVTELWSPQVKLIFREDSALNPNPNLTLS